jgi:hypothetical protein
MRFVILYTKSAIVYNLIKQELLYIFVINQQLFFTFGDIIRQLMLTTYCHLSLRNIFFQHEAILLNDRILLNKRLYLSPQEEI